MRRLVDVPFNRPHVVGTEFDLIAEAIDNSYLAGNGPFSRRCSEHLEGKLGASRVLLTHSCTGALEMAAILSEVGPGDEVVMPSFTFPSTANAFALRGATPVFVDIREDTLNLDESLVADAVTDRTRAIAPVHYAGVGCEMDTINEIAADAGAWVIEDAAQAVGASWRGRPLGTFGAASGLSFHETKNVIAGEGGALVINDPDWIERAEILHEKGTNRSAFFRGETDKYTWVDIGSSFLLSDITAAFLFAQLENEAEITAARLAVWDRYHAAFEGLEAEGRVRRPVIPAEAGHNAHLYYLLFADEGERDAVSARMREQGVQALFHYIPLHSSPAGSRLGRPAGEMAVTDATSARLLRLPLWVGMEDAQVEAVVNAVSDALGN
jgi:dTDP-4-amino-4,6-dideoxygalactose transaminase